MNTQPPQMSPYSPPLAHQPQVKKRGVSVVLIVLGVVGGGALMVVLLCAGLLFLGMRGISSRQPTAQEKQAVFTVADLAPRGIPQTKLPEREEWNCKKNFDGSLEIEYEYDPEKSGDDQVFRLMSSVEIEPSEEDARESFGMAVTAYGVGLQIGGVTSDKQPYAVPWADQSHFALINNNSGSVGNLAIIRKGKRLHALLLVGYCFQDPEDLAEMLRAKVDASAGLNAK